MDKTIIVYINRENRSNKHYKAEKTPLTNVLHKLTLHNASQESYCLSGCDINNNDSRDLGSLFTFNLESQVDAVVSQIKKEISHLNPGDTLTLNLYGEELGAAGVFLICQKLKETNIEINVCAFNPTTKNMIWTAYADTVLGVKYTLSTQISDLRPCKNIKNLLVLFTNRSPQVPILPMLPEQANVRVDVVPGNQKTGLFTLNNNSVIPNTNRCTILCHYVTQFLEDTCNTKFIDDADFPRDPVIQLLEIENLIIKSKYADEKLGSTTHTRQMYSSNEIITKKDRPYVNILHKELITKEVKTIDCLECSLYVQPQGPIPHYPSRLQFSRQFTELAKRIAVVGALSYLFCEYPLIAIATLGGAFAYKKYRQYRQNQEEEPSELHKAETKTETTLSNLSPESVPKKPKPLPRRPASLLNLQEIAKRPKLSEQQDNQQKEVSKITEHKITKLG